MLPTPQRDHAALLNRPRVDVSNTNFFFATRNIRSIASYSPYLLSSATRGIVVFRERGTLTPLLAHTFVDALVDVGLARWGRCVIRPK
jgi:hypothetical protein